MSEGLGKPDGLPCVDCKANGHFAPATDWLNGQPVCMFCLDGARCPVMRHYNLAPPSQRPPVMRNHSAPVERPAIRKIPDSPETRHARAEVPQRQAPAAAPTGKPSGTAAVLAAAAGTPLQRKPYGRQKCSSCQQPAHAGTCKCTRGCGGPRHRGRCPGQVVKARDGAVVVKAWDGAVVVGGARPAKPAEPKPAAKAEAAPPCAVCRHAAHGSKCNWLAPEKAVEAKVGEWEVVELAEVPAHTKGTLYEDAVAYLRTLAQGQVMKRTFNTVAIAHTTMHGICRVARNRRNGMQVSARQDGKTVWIWQRPASTEAKGTK